MKLCDRRAYWDRIFFLTLLCLLTLGVSSANVRAQSGVLDRVEITNEEYLLFIQATGHPEPEDWSGGTFAEGTEREPVTLVTWHDAVAYCRWASGKRLPSVAEWVALCTDNKLTKRGDIWEWTSTEVGTDDDSFKALCGPMGTCDCSHRYRPHWKNSVKGFRCARDSSPVAANDRERARGSEAPGTYSCT